MIYIYNIIIKEYKYINYHLIKAKINKEEQRATRIYEKENGSSNGI